MIQRRTLIGAIGAVALSSASYFPMTACAAMPRGEGSDPIRIVVPYPPGGPPDVSARTIAEAVVDTLGHVTADHRPGLSPIQLRRCRRKERWKSKTIFCAGM